MNHCVPECELDGGDPFLVSSLVPAPHRRKISESALAESELLELIWQNGPVAQPVHGDRIRGLSPPPPPPPEGAGSAALSGRADAGSVADVASQLFMEEDEMASWLHYQIGGGRDGGGGDDLFLGSSPQDIGNDGRAAAAAAEAEAEAEASNAAAERLPAAPKESAVGSNEVSVVEVCDPCGIGTGGGGGPPRACEQALSSSSEASSERWAMAHADERKRKAREEGHGDGGGSGCHSQKDVEFRTGEKKKGARGSVAGRRSRAAEVHNLSERRRRDRINEKMKALQELIPRCNKSDKASMLDEAIGYLKSLQSQIQMMSAGCSINPAMFPAVQPYMPPMAMGMRMGMGMHTGMNMAPGMTIGAEVGGGVLRPPMLPFGPLLPCASIASPARPLPIMPSTHPPNVVNANQFRVQADSKQALASNMQSQYRGQIPHGGDPYHGFVLVNPFQVSPQPGVVDKPEANKQARNNENIPHG